MQIYEIALGYDEGGEASPVPAQWTKLQPGHGVQLLQLERTHIPRARLVIAGYRRSFELVAGAVLPLPSDLRERWLDVQLLDVGGGTSVLTSATLAALRGCLVLVERPDLIDRMVPPLGWESWLQPVAATTSDVLGTASAIILAVPAVGARSAVVTMPGASVTATMPHAGILLEERICGTWQIVAYKPIIATRSGSPHVYAVQRQLPLVAKLSGVQDAVRVHAYKLNSAALTITVSDISLLLSDADLPVPSRDGQRFTALAADAGDYSLDASVQLEQNHSYLFLVVSNPSANVGTANVAVMSFHHAGDRIVSRVATGPVAVAPGATVVNTAGMGYGAIAFSAGASAIDSLLSPVAVSVANRIGA